MKKTWDNILTPPDTNNTVWELFHLNARCSKIDSSTSLLQNNNGNKSIPDITPYVNYPSISLPHITENLDMLLIDAIKCRSSQYNMLPTTFTLEKIATLLLQSYSLIHDNIQNSNLCQHRTTPSAGALYPIEIFFHYAAPDNEKESNFDTGLYYYNPERQELRCLINKNCCKQINEILIQKDVAENSSLQIFITSMFSRSTIKYGDRGYKFSLLEAGHVAQNINLVTTAMGLSSINIGGYYEKEANEFLGIDGLSHSTVYMIAVGIEKIQRQE